MSPIRKVKKVTGKGARLYRRLPNTAASKRHTATPTPEELANPHRTIRNLKLLLQDYLQEQALMIATITSIQVALSDRSGQTPIQISDASGSVIRSRLRKLVKRLLPFITGRKQGAVGPLKALVRKLIAASLSAGKPNAQISPAPLWQACRNKQPRGFTFSGHAGDASAEVWINAENKGLPYKRFADIVGEVKRERGMGRVRRRIPK